MKSILIVKIELIPLNLQMRTPFITSLGEKRVSRNLLILIGLENGMTGYGEASASLAWPLDTQEAMMNSLRTIMPWAVGSPIQSWKQTAHRTWSAVGQHPTAAAAFECALLDAFTRTQKLSLWQFFGGKRRFVTTGFTISAWPSKKAAYVARELSAEGFGIFKIKVTGRDTDEDLKRVLAVHKASPRAKIIIDANQGFQSKQAIQFIELLRSKRIPVLLVEQPVAKENWEGLKEVERKGKIPVAADESARGTEDAKKLIRKKMVSVVNIKLAKSGILGAFEIMRLARSNSTQLMIGCMAESAIGLAPSVHLAAGTGAFRFVDLDSHLLVRSPKGIAGFKTRGARLSVDPRQTGSGSKFNPPPAKIIMARRPLEAVST